MSPAGESDALKITLDRDADVPLGVQLAWALRTRIAGGALAPGARLPALHRLAAAVGLNVNTVRAVYQRLEQDGLVDTRHGSGTFVRAGDGGGAGEPGALAQLAADAARAAREAGVDPREVAAALYVDAPPALASQPAQRGGEAAERRRLRTQIAALEQALSAFAARTPAPEPRLRSPKPRLLTAAELAHQRDALLQQLTDAQADAARPRSARPPEPPRARRRAPARAAKLRPSTGRA